MDGKTDIKSISVGIRIMSEEQELVNKILGEILKIIVIRNLCNENYNLNIKEELDLYFASFIHNISIGREHYSYSFPFYGYRPFVDRLLNFCKENEEFEKSSRLKEIVDSLNNEYTLKYRKAV